MATMSRDLERGLVSAGVERDQAEQIADGLDASLADVATKEDISTLRREIGQLREDTQRLLYWVLALLSAMIVGGFAGLIIALSS